MKKYIFITFLILFVFLSCSNTVPKQKIEQKDRDKLQKVIKLVKNHYIEEIPKEKYLDTKKRYQTQKDIEFEIERVMNNLDKHSIYINKNKKSNTLNKRKKISAPISFKIIEKKYLYILVPYFYKNTAKKISIIIKKHNNLNLILDLRDNPGGYLKESIKTVDLFIDSGVIISQVGRKKNLTKSYYATMKNTITSRPMVVLINNKTASSAEIVSGALQHHKRGILIGTESYGKGTVQALIYITDDKKEAIKLTIGKYYLSSKRTINNKIQPNILVQKNNVIDNKNDLQLEQAIKYLDKMKTLVKR